MTKISIKLSLIIIYFIIQTTYCLNSQQLFKVDKKYNADVVVFIVNKEYKADLKIFIVDKEYKAKGNEGKWFFTKYKSNSKKVIYFTEKEFEADIKAYVVDREYKSGWINKSKMYLFY